MKKGSTIRHTDPDYEKLGPRLCWEDARLFAKHPIKAYDPLFSRDTNNFNVVYGQFIRFLKHELNLLIDLGDSSPGSRDTYCELRTMYHEVRTKVDNYAGATGTSLLPRYSYAL